MTVVFSSRLIFTWNYGIMWSWSSLEVRGLEGLWSWSWPWYSWPWPWYSWPWPWRSLAMALMCMALALALMAFLTTSLIKDAKKYMHAYRMAPVHHRHWPPSDRASRPRCSRGHTCNIYIVTPVNCTMTLKYSFALKSRLWTFVLLLLLLLHCCMWTDLKDNDKRMASWRCRLPSHGCHETHLCCCTIIIGSHLDPHLCSTIHTE